jgi:hypothetical protein
MGVVLAAVRAFSGFYKRFEKKAADLLHTLKAD